MFPIVCEECDWREHDWLRATQTSNGGDPIARCKPETQERVFRQIATDIAEQISRAALGKIPQGTQSELRVYLDKFPLTHGSDLFEARLIGRDQELALIDLAFAQPHTAIVSLVAWGGVGKTMLAQHWIKRLQSEGWFGVRRVYAWSFYSQGTTEDRQASEDMFLAHALEWFGVQYEPTLSPWDKGRLLADAVSRERALLILDGIEPLRYPPGPMGGQLRAPGVQNLLKQIARRANNDEHLGLCLVTTREPLTDLADFQRRPNASWGSVLRVDLGNLTEEAGASLLHHAGAKRAGSAEIECNDTELLAASREVDGHALTLTLLGRFIARAHGADIRRRDLVKFDDADRHEQGGTTFKMLAAFENWFAKGGEFGARQLAVLRILSLFDQPAGAGCIRVLRKPPAIVGLTGPLFMTRVGTSTADPLDEEDWNAATSFLVDFGLIAIQTAVGHGERLLDCHPLIREHFAKQLSETMDSAWRDAHRRLYEHLFATTEEGERPTLQDLQPLYQAVAHGCLAGMHREADYYVYDDRIQRGRATYSTKNLGAFGSDLEAIACFFETPWTRVSPVLNDVEQAWLLNESACVLRALGRLTESIEPMRAALRHYLQHEHWELAARVANNVSELDLTQGEVFGAVSQAEEAVTYADRSGAPFMMIGSRSALGDALHHAGREADAKARFSESERLQVESQRGYPLLYSVQGFWYCDLLLTVAERETWREFLRGPLHSSSDDQRAAASKEPRILGRGATPPRQTRPAAFQSCRPVKERAAQTLRWVTNQGWLLDIALDQLTLGREALYSAVLEDRTGPQSLHSSSPNRSAFTSARREIDSAVASLRRAGTMHYVRRGLLTDSWLHFLEGDAVASRADLDEAWDIAERGPMRLYLADVHLHRARLFFREEPYPWKSPQDDLAAAEKLINECSYRRRGEELADAKRAILGL